MHSISTNSIPIRTLKRTEVPRVHGGSAGVEDLFDWGGHLFNQAWGWVGRNIFDSGTTETICHGAVAGGIGVATAFASRGRNGPAMTGIAMAGGSLGETAASRICPQIAKAGQSLLSGPHRPHR